MSLGALGCNPAYSWTPGDDDDPGAIPGMLAYSPDGGLYRCVQASAAIDQYESCTIGGDFRAAPSAANTAPGARIGIAQADIANGDRGWLLVDGKGQVNVGANAAANAVLSTIAGGALDDGGSTEHVVGVQLTAARGGTAGPAPCSVQWPFVLN